MSKTLSNILTVFKVARIIAKVVYICSIVGGAICLVGLTPLSLFDGVPFAPLLSEEGLDIPSAYVACGVGAVTCAGEAVFAFMAERYFKNVLKASTPFTLDGSKECFRLGIASLIIAAATSVASGIVYSIAQLLASTAVAEPELSMISSISTGLFFLFLSLVFKHGAEMQNQNHS